MKGSEWAHALQAAGEETIQSAVLHAVENGLTLPICWQPVPVSAGGLSGVVFVAARPLSVGTPDDHVFAMVSAETAQHIADRLKVLQPTTRILDAAYRAAAIGVQPVPTQPADPQDREESGHSPSMKDASAMQMFSFEVNRAAFGLPGLVGMPFKVWAITNKLVGTNKNVAFNYGFFDLTAPYSSASGVRMWQTLGSSHNCKHWDYSQVFIAVHPAMLVNGEWVNVAAVGSDPKLCALVSSEGVVKTWRQPCVPDPNIEEADTLPPPPDSGESSVALDFDRTLRLTKPYMRGGDVIQWQQFLRVVADGVFGPQTEGATRQFQLAAGLVPDGIVGPKTVAEANEEFETLGVLNSELTPGDLVSAYRQAKSWQWAERTKKDIHYIVIHTAETSEKPTVAEALMNWAAGPDAPNASWHFAVDDDSITQSVQEQSIAWHAPGVNEVGIGIELSGRAGQTPEEWTDDFSINMLDRAAKLVAALCVKWDIPIEYVGVEELEDGGSRGITTHRAVTFAFRRSTHTDPGEHFPMEAFLNRVRHYAMPDP